MDPFEGTPYRLIRPLGEGGMGEVFEIEHDILGKRLVAKILRAELSDTAGVVDRMRIEAQALGALSHPNLVSVTDFRKTADGRPFYVMEKLEGCTLREELRARGPLDPRFAIYVTRQVLSALAAAHGAGLVHRDIKLDNVFLHTKAGRRHVKLLDFGVAKVLAGRSDKAPEPLALPTAEGVLIGTPRYASPEQLLGRKVDERTDLYSTGLLLYHLLTGRGPFDGVDKKELLRAVLERVPEPPSRFAPNALPPNLDAIVLRALEKSPDARFRTAEHFELALATIAEALDEPSVEAPPVEPEPKLVSPPAPAVPTEVLHPSVSTRTVAAEPAPASSAPTYALSGTAAVLASILAMKLTPSREALALVAIVGSGALAAAAVTLLFGRAAR